ncbi:hypothetical protein FOZG_17931 [Fusarium oxysporum Fo47]|uniref:Lipase-like C-terminal domain-containing protein n=1 Tax=Fusarium oxysporum Fo47 TaxID=660027 RepID=W9JD28_FUSOX|nr:hypothetical protein FOZG_17931 [Fusarium oxysporum Fo47]
MFLTSTLFIIVTLGGLFGKSVLSQTLNDPDGLVNLRNLAKETERTAADKSIPIVFVPGFSGWGAPLFGALNYFGGVIDIPNLLADMGYTVIVAPVAPISTNWERACELYRQLTFGNTTGRRRAIQFSNSPDFRNWKWDRDRKVHFVCHSQGGNTVRYLISLMANGAGTLHPTYFAEAGRDDWIISVTTLGTPHRGTTIINALESFLSRSRQQAVGLVARLFATASFYPPEKRAYDLQLDHWGIRRNSGETFQGMLARMESVNGSVSKWLNSSNNGLYDNSIEGVHNLSLKAINTSENIYYFSLSFHATDPFPEAWPEWGRDAIDSFPTNIESFRSFVEWVTKAVITRVLQELGYDLALPNPGRYIPRKDVIPILLPSVYAMGSQELTQVQRDILGPNLGDWYQNDGIVNTESMSGPDNFVRGINSLPDLNFSVDGKRGIYWHLGVNDQMDHADQIGVFIEQSTGNLMKEMYLNIANLISRLPVH